MSLQPEGGASTERSLYSDGGQRTRSVHRQEEASNSSDQYRPPATNDRGPYVFSTQKDMGDTAQKDEWLNGGQPQFPGDGRSGREREISQDLPLRERSRKEGSTGGDTAGSQRGSCTHCGQSLKKQFVRALGGTYHLECFMCRVSGEQMHIVDRR